MFQKYAYMVQQFANVKGTELRVLDIGASAGEPALTIAMNNPSLHVVSSDLHDINEDLGRRRALKVKAENIEFRTLNAEDLSSLETESFDIVICSYGLMYFDVDKALPEFLRVLKMEGLFAATVWNEQTKHTGFMNIFESLHEKGVFPEDPSFDPCKYSKSVPGFLQEKLLTSGFTNAFAETAGYSHEYGEPPNVVAENLLKASPYYQQAEDRGLTKEAITVMADRIIENKWVEGEKRVIIPGNEALFFFAQKAAKTE